MTDNGHSTSNESVVPDAEIYWRPGCGYCALAMELFDRKDVDVVTYNVWGEDKDIKEDMLKRSDNAQTVPQIFVRGEHIGGATELLELEKSGDLDRMLRRT